MSDIKRLAKHSSIYTIGNLLTKMVGFIMLPLYTHYLTPADYGTLEIVMLAFPLITVFMGMGMSQATIRYYYDSDLSIDRKQVVGTALTTSIILSFLGSLFLIVISDQLSMLLFQESGYSYAIKLAVIALFFELSMEVPLSFIRVKEYSVLYVSISLIRLLLAVLLNILFLAYLNMSYEGILYSSIITAGLEFIVLYSLTFKYCGFCFSVEKLKQMALYGYPLIFAGLGMIILNLVDRYFLTIKTDLATVGLYAVSLKFASLLSIGFIIPFWRSYGPFRFSIMNKPDAKVIYADVFRFFMVIVTWIGIGIALLSRELIILMTGDEFWSAYDTVPLLVVGGVLYGIYYLTQTGIYIHKKTQYIAYIINVVALFKIASSWYLIEYFNAQGAALSVVLSFSLLTCITFIVSQRLYFIKYSWLSLIKTIFLGVVLYYLISQVVLDSVMFTLIVKSILLLSFPVLVVFTGIITQDEFNKFKFNVASFISSKL